MEIASLVIACASVAVAGVAAWDARQSRRTALEALHDSRRPRLTLRMLPAEPGRPFLAEVTSDRDLERLVLFQGLGRVTSGPLLALQGIVPVDGIGIRRAKQEEIPKLPGGGTYGGMHTLIADGVAAGAPLRIMGLVAGAGPAEARLLLLRCEFTVQGEKPWPVEVLDTGTQPVNTYPRG